MSVWGKPLIINAKYGANVYDATANPIEQGNIASSDGQDTTNSQTVRLRTNGYIPVTAGKAYVVDTNIRRVYCYYYDSNHGYTSGSASGWITAPATITIPSGKEYLRVVIAYSGSSTVLTPADVTSFTIRPAQNSMIYIS